MGAILQLHKHIATVQYKSKASLLWTSVHFLHSVLLAVDIFLFLQLLCTSS